MYGVHRMGDRIKTRREALGMSASDLAKAIGVTSSSISQIERAKSYPSILTLKKISDAMQTTVGELIGEYETLLTNPLLKVKDRKFVKKNKNGTKLYLLSNHDPIKHMDPFIVEFTGDSDSTGIMSPSNPRQEFCYLISGHLKVELGDNEFELQQGDSFYFKSNQQHLFINAGAEQSELLWVVNQLST